MKQLDEEGAERISAYVGMRKRLDDVAANVEADRIRAQVYAEIRQLAAEHTDDCQPGCCLRYVIADLIPEGTT